MNSEVIEYLSEFLLKFSKSNNLPEEWADKTKQAFLQWIGEASEPVKADLLSCFQQLEASSKKPGRVRKFFNGFFKEFIKRLAKDPGGKSRYTWADKAYYMRQDLNLDYKHIYPAVCKKATDKEWEELTESEKEDFRSQCRQLVYERKSEARKKSRKPKHRDTSQ